MRGIYEKRTQPRIGIRDAVGVLGVAAITLGVGAQALRSWTGSASAVSVRQHGATGKGAFDDTRAIQGVIDACNGGTVVFPAGRYRVTSPLMLRGNCSYIGRGRAELIGYQGRGAGGFAIAKMYTDIRNVRISGLIFNGGGVSVITNGPARGLTITRNTFRNIQNTNSPADSPGHSAIYIGKGSSQISRLTITGNTIEDITYGGTYPVSIPSLGGKDWDGSAIGVDGALDYEISDNTFARITGDAIKMPPNYRPMPHPGPYRIRRNTFNGIHRIAIETQEGYTGSCVHNLAVEGNVVNSFITPYWGSMGLSIVPWCADAGSHVSQNRIYLSPAGPAVPLNHGNGDFNYGIGIELGVPLADSNIIESVTGDTGPAIFISILQASRAVIRNNRVCGPHKGADWYGYNNSQVRVPTAILINNSYQPVCSGAARKPANAALLSIVPGSR